MVGSYITSEAAGSAATSLAKLRVPHVFFEDTRLLPELRNRLVLGVHHYSWKLDVRSFAAVRYTEVGLSSSPCSTPYHASPRNGPGRYLPFAHLRRSGWQLFSRSSEVCDAVSKSSCV